MVMHQRRCGRFTPFPESPEYCCACGCFAAHSTGLWLRRGSRRCTAHELRHTAASFAIASGANIKVVQQMLGHASAVMTLDLYGHPFADQLDEVADRMDAAPASVLLPVRCPRSGW